jgi:hypothetical protein
MGHLIRLHLHLGEPRIQQSHYVALAIQIDDYAGHWNANTRESRPGVPRCQHHRYSLPSLQDTAHQVVYDGGTYITNEISSPSTRYTPTPKSPVRAATALDASRPLLVLKQNHSHEAWTSSGANTHSLSIPGLLGAENAPHRLYPGSGSRLADVKLGWCPS